MGRKVLAMSGVWLLACAVLAAADFWEEKEFTAWSDRDVDKMMSSSPWAKRLTVVFPRTPRSAQESGTGGGRLGGGDAVDLLDRLAESQRRPDGFGGGNTQTRLIIQWRSALPIRQAMLRGQLGQGGTIEPEVQAALNQSPTAYFVVVTGVPGQFGRLTPDALMAEARLERKGKSPIVPVEAGPRPEGQSVALVYAFPKDDAIVLEDKEVEFVAKVGDTTIKKKFKLEDMVFNDQLEL